VTSLREVEWHDCLVEPRPDPELERRFARRTGRPPGVVRYFTGVPWAGDHFADLSAQLQTHVHLDAELSDLVGLVVSQDNSCRYCFASTRALLRILGMPEARIARLEQEALTSDLGAREREALRFARRLSRANPAPTREDLRPLAEAGFSEGEITELASMAALHLFFNRLSTLIALPPEPMEDLPDRLLARLTRPLLALRFRRVRRRSPPVRLAPGEAEGPFAPIVTALDGLPLARVLRGLLDEVLDSELLSREVKLLVFAVVARALGCPHCEGEAVRCFREVGGPEEVAAEVLAHLTCAKLDPLEASILPFARETIRYEPIHIQRRGRELAAQLGRERFLEVVMVCALANAVVRLRVLTEEAA
jgi:uncharacterized peroxidase-related enzyme